MVYLAADSDLRDAPCECYESFHGKEKEAFVILLIVDKSRIVVIQRVRPFRSIWPGTLRLYSDLVQPDHGRSGCDIQQHRSWT